MTDSLTASNKFIKKKQKFYDMYDTFSLKNPIPLETNPATPAGTVLKITVPAGVELIKIPENHEYSIFENEYVIPAGTLVKTEKQGTHIHVLSPKEERKERLKVKEKDIVN